MNKSLVFANVGKDVSGCSTYEEVVEYANLDYKVELRDIVIKGSDVAIPNVKAICKTKPLELIATCKSKYTIINNEDAFKSFNNIAKVGKFKWLRAFGNSDYESYFIGRIDKVFNHTNEPITSNKNCIVFYVIMVNSYNTKTPQAVMITPVKESTILPLPKASHYISRHTSEVITEDRSKELYDSILGSISSLLDFYNWLIGYEIDEWLLYSKLISMHINDNVSTYVAGYNNYTFDKAKALANYKNLFELREPKIVKKFAIKELMLNKIQKLFNEVKASSTGDIFNMFDLYYTLCRDIDNSYTYPTEYARFDKELNNKEKIKLIESLYEKYLETIAK